MTRILLVPTVRPDMMRTLMASLHHLPADWRLWIAFQAYSDDDIHAIVNGPGGERIVRFLRMPERYPPYQTRLEMLRRWLQDEDIIVNLDDDMELLPTVDYAAMAERVVQPGVGVVSGNWGRSPALLKRAVHRAEWIEQPIVNMAGGMMYSAQTARDFLAAPDEPYLFCDVQAALVAYVAGRVNYRYRGSLIVHRIMSKGGLKTSYALRDFALPPPDLMTVKPCTEVYVGRNNNYYMPDSGSLTPEAHARHRDNRKARGWA